MLVRPTTYVWTLIATVACTMLYGCSQPKKPANTPLPPEKLFEGTVGMACELTGYTGVRVQGYSLVLGLPRTGSAECSAPVKKYLIQAILKLKKQKRLPALYAHMDGEHILASTSTAAVMVTGIVPPGAPKGQRFDVQVRVLEGTQTTSLQGGRLMPTELRVVVPRAGRQLARHVTASAEGPIFINPFPLSADSAQKVNPRVATVLGGGLSRKDRNVGLSLLNPDHRLAQQIQNRINSRFNQPDGPNVAEASREFVKLTVPGNYRDNYQHFIKLVWALYLQQRPGYLELKLRELQQALTQPDPDYDTIALAWEAIGRSSLAYLRPYYENPEKARLAFYAARTALYLNERKAIDALIKMALDDNHPAQNDALRILTEVPDDVRAHHTLVQLLGHQDNALRLLAYRGLQKVGDPVIDSALVGHAFRLDLVKSDAPSMIAVWATHEPRIVLFGPDTRCPSSLFFESPDETLTINCRPNDQLMTVTRQLTFGDQSRVVSFTAQRNVQDLIWALARSVPGSDGAEIVGPGLTFSEIVGTLHQLCRKEIIPAAFTPLQRVEPNP